MIVSFSLEFLKNILWWTLLNFYFIAGNPKKNNVNIFHFSFGVTQLRVLRLKNKGKKCPHTAAPRAPRAAPPPDFFVDNDS